MGQATKGKIRATKIILPLLRCMIFEVHTLSEVAAKVDNLPTMTVTQMKRTSLPDEVGQVVEEGRLMGEPAANPKKEKMSKGKERGSKAHLEWFWACVSFICFI
jgi:hypothetical protein